MAKPRVQPLNVFINCPFDARYKKHFEAIVFTVARCGFVVRCALEINDSGGTRIEKIVRLIEACPYGIHDLCRTELDTKNKLPRFNMPLELGLFLGAQRYGDAKQRGKLCLVLDREPFRYQKFISDIAGQDIRSHDMTNDKIIGAVRDFLRSLRADNKLPSTTTITREFAAFQKEKPGICRKTDTTAKSLTYHDLNSMIVEWLTGNAGKV
jgi:hypothetical protein